MLLGIIITASILAFALMARYFVGRRKAARNRSYSEEKFRILFEYSSDAHLILDDANIIDCNNAAVEILRCRDKNHLLSLAPARLSPEQQPDGRTSIKKSAEMDKIARRKGYHRFEWLHRRLDGQDFPVEVTLTPMTLSGKRAMLAVWHDITEQKNYRMTLEKLHLLTIDKDLPFEQKTDAMLKLGADYLKTRSGIIGRIEGDVYEILYLNPISDSLQKGMKFSFQDAFWMETLKSEKPLAFHNISENIDANKYSALKVLPIESYIGCPIYVDGAFFGAISFVDTISRAKPYGEYEINFIQLAAGWIGNEITRERSVKMKNEFVSTVSHELRTPLTSIRGSLGLVIGGITGEVPVAARNLLEIAYKNCERLVGLINDILDMEKIEAGNMHFAMQPVLLAEVLEQALEANQGLEIKYNIGFKVENKMPEAWINVDSGRLIQIITNLLSNAAKFSPANSMVDVSAAPLGGSVRISVRDYGPGIPDDFIPRIFQKFAQANSADNRLKGGTGLGLSIAREMAEKMGGKVGFGTKAGAGSIFYIDLPLLENEKLRNSA